jgi:hypothetical protein
MLDILYSISEMDNRQCQCCGCQSGIVGTLVRMAQTEVSQKLTPASANHFPLYAHIWPNR